MKYVILFSVFFLLFQGCATPYQHSGFSGGYSETQLDENVFKVSFRGNGYTGQERASDFALLRCAELALENGYDYFVIIEADSYTSSSTYSTPSTSRTTGSAYTYGNHTYGSATTTTTGGQTYVITKPRSTNTVICLKEKPDEGFSYSAEFVYKSITEKYGIKKKPQ